MTQLFHRVETTARHISRAIHGTTSKFVAADDGSAVIYDPRHATAYFISMRGGIERLYEGDVADARRAMLISDNTLAAIGYAGARWIGGV